MNIGDQGMTFSCETYEIADIELEEESGFDTVYRQGGRLSLGRGILTIETSVGVNGTTMGGIDARTAQSTGPGDHLA